MFRHSAIGIVSLFLWVTSAIAQDKRASTITFDDAEFVAKAASGGMHEVELGKLASTQARSEDVKKFGEKMVTDHGKAGEALKKAANAAGITLPEKMNEEHQKEFDKFKDKKGDAFDKAYVNHMVKDHEGDVELFTKASKEANNPELKRFATTTLPVVKEHLKMIKKIQDSMK